MSQPQVCMLMRLVAMSNYYRFYKAVGLLRVSREACRGFLEVKYKVKNGICSHLTRGKFLPNHHGCLLRIMTIFHILLMFEVQCKKGL